MFPSPTLSTPLSPHPLSIWLIMCIHETCPSLHPAVNAFAALSEHFIILFSVSVRTSTFSRFSTATPSIFLFYTLAGLHASVPNLSPPSLLRLCFISSISPAVPLAPLSLPSHLLIMPWLFCRGRLFPVAPSLSPDAPHPVPDLSDFLQTQSLRLSAAFLSLYFPSFIRLPLPPPIHSWNYFFIVHIHSSIHPANYPSSVPSNPSAPYSSGIKKKKRQSMSRDKLSPQVTVYVPADRNQSAPRDTTTFCCVFPLRYMHLCFVSPFTLILPRFFFLKRRQKSLQCNTLFLSSSSLSLRHLNWEFCSATFDLVHTTGRSVKMLDT